MANNDATVTLKADIAKFRAEFQRASREIKLANAEFKATSATMDNWADNADGLRAKVKQLNSVLDAQKKQLDELDKELKSTIELNGEHSAAADRVRLKIEAQKKAIAETEKGIDKYTKELSDCENETGKFAKSTEEADKAMEQISDGFTVAKGALANLVADGIRVAIGAMKDLAAATIQTGIDFEASMSKVKAISGANAEDMELLTAKAKEMGEKTVFSASESAAAFQYMAMAGWKTEDMLNGIEGIMNLAAASGEDLATTSDIVTDALTAFGLEAKDAGRLADVMAAASSNANTNVSMLGESFKYVAPLAGSMGYSAEDVATALGLMANSGIKASAAGTALRTLLTNLAKPTDQMSEAMDALGLSLTDGEGSMKTLSEIMQDLRKGFAGLKTSTKDYEKGLALLDQQLEAGTIEQKDYDAAVEELAKSTFTAEGALKAEAAAMLSGKTGLSGLMAIVNSSDADFQKLTGAIEGSTGAAEQMATVMNDNVGGQITLLKSKVEGIMIKVFDRAKDSIRGGIDNISDALDSIDWDKVAKAVGDFAKKVLDLFSWIIRNGDVIIEVLKSIAKVAATIWAVKKVSQFAQAINTGITAVKGFAAAIKAAGTATETMNAASGILGSLVSPGGAIALGLAAIVTVTATIISLTKDEAQEVAILTDEQEKNIKKSEELAAAYHSLETERQNSMQAVNNEYDRYGDLMSRLDELVAANGRVQTGKEQEVAFILNELNNAFGTEMQLIDGVVKGYQTEREELEKLMTTKRAEAILAANEAAYAEAYAKRTEAAQQMAIAQNDFNDAVVAAEAKQAEVNAVYEEYNRILEGTSDWYGRTGYEAAEDFMYANKDAASGLDVLQQAVTETRAGLIQATDAYEGYNTVVRNYEGLASSIIEGDQDKINDALLRTENNLKDHTSTTTDELKAQAEKYENIYRELERAQKEGDAEISEEQLKSAKRLADITWSEYLKGGTGATAGFKKGVTDTLDDVKEAGESVGDTSVSGLEKSLEEHSPSKRTARSGENFAQGFINGLGGKGSAVYRKAYELAQKAIAGLKAGQEEHSPSKLTYKSGVNFVKGFVNGIASMTKSAVKTASSLAKTVVKQGLALTDYNFDDVASSVAESYTSALSAKVSYTLEKIAYQNEQKLKSFDAEIEKLRANMDKENNDHAKEVYTALIEEQQAQKAAYQSASQKMIAEYTSALNAYQNKAKTLVQSTIKGITDGYKAAYNELVQKQDALADKMRGANSLFNISGAGVLTVNDITAQTAQIRDYAKKLQTIKGKVSAALFDEIAGYDMQEGGAFIDQLLQMSEKDLKAYSAAYDEKIAASKKLAEQTYKKDIAQVEKDYKTELKQAFANLPAELEALGVDAMTGFVDGLTKNTDYMSDEIKTYVAAMVDEYKKDLKIASPSKVMAQIGEFTGEGFIDGMKETISAARSTAREIISAVSSPLGRFEYSNMLNRGGGVAGGSSVVNNYNLVQNNNSPKSLSALETYRARRQQIALIKALT